MSFFAPHGAYAAGGDPRREFRDMVKALHAAGIGVILDVVLNHTAEGGADGPTIGYKGLVNELFYLLDPEDRSKYLDFTGCGNTVSSNQPLVAQWLVEVLAVLGRRDARRRLPVRSGRRAVARRAGQAARARARDRGHRARSGARAACT